MAFVQSLAFVQSMAFVQYMAFVKSAKIRPKLFGTGLLRARFQNKVGAPKWLPKQEIFLVAEHFFVDSDAILGCFAW